MQANQSGSHKLFSHDSVYWLETEVWPPIAPAWSRDTYDSLMLFCLKSVKEPILSKSMLQNLFFKSKFQSCRLPWINLRNIEATRPIGLLISVICFHSYLFQLQTDSLFIQAFSKRWIKVSKLTNSISKSLIFVFSQITIHHGPSAIS